MKTIGYIDRCDGNKRLKAFNMYEFNKKMRFEEALKDLKGMGNIDLYLIRGNKYRKIATRSI